MSADAPNDSSVKACRNLLALSVVSVGCMVSVGEAVTVGAGVELLLALGVGTLVVVGAGLVVALLFVATGDGAGLVDELVLTTGVGNIVSFKEGIKEGVTEGIKEGVKEGAIDGVVVTSSSIVAATKVPAAGCMVSVGATVKTVAVFVVPCRESGRARNHTVGGWRVFFGCDRCQDAQEQIGHGRLPVYDCARDARGLAQRQAQRRRKASQRDAFRVFYRMVKFLSCRNSTARRSRSPPSPASSVPRRRPRL